MEYDKSLVEIINDIKEAVHIHQIDIHSYESVDELYAILGYDYEYEHYLNMLGVYSTSDLMDLLARF